MSESAPGNWDPGFAEPARRESTPAIPTTDSSWPAEQSPWNPPKDFCDPSARSKARRVELKQVLMIHVLAPLACVPAAWCGASAIAAADSNLFLIGSAPLLLLLPAMICQRATRPVVGALAGCVVVLYTNYWFVDWLGMPGEVFTRHPASLHTSFVIQNPGDLKTVTHDPDLLFPILWFRLSWPFVLAFLIALLQGARSHREDLSSSEAFGGYLIGMWMFFAILLISAVTAIGLRVSNDEAARKGRSPFSLYELETCQLRLGRTVDIEILANKILRDTSTVDFWRLIEFKQNLDWPQWPQLAARIREVMTTDRGLGRRAAWLLLQELRENLQELLGNRKISDRALLLRGVDFENLFRDLLAWSQTKTDQGECLLEAHIQCMLAISFVAPDQAPCSQIVDLMQRVGAENEMAGCGYLAAALFSNGRSATPDYRDPQKWQSWFLAYAPTLRIVQINSSFRMRPSEALFSEEVALWSERSELRYDFKHAARPSDSSSADNSSAWILAGVMTCDNDSIDSSSRLVSIDRVALRDADDPLVPLLDLAIIHKETKEMYEQNPYELALAFEVPAARAFDRVRLEMDLRVGYERELVRCMSKIIVLGH